MATDYATSGDARGTFLGHPKGLFMLFFAEMWERFSYYGMKALLIFYLTQHWLFSDGESGVIYGAYTALVYITPVLGGYLADRWLGQRKAVLFGAVLLTMGHFLMGFEGDGGKDAFALDIFWLALSFIIVGSGFLKANISVMVGQLYELTDKRRDGAYTIFYMGINLGAMMGSALCGYIGQTYSWSYGFGLAGFGMLLGLIVFVVGKPLLLGRGEPQNPALLKTRISGLPFEWLIYVVSFASVGAIWLMIQYQEMVGWLLFTSGITLLAYVLAIAAFKFPYGAIGNAPRDLLSTFVTGFIAILGMALLLFLNGQDYQPAYYVGTSGLVIVIATLIVGSMRSVDHGRDRIFAAIFLMIGSILFWALFEQAGSSLNLYTDRYVERAGVPASVFQSINSIYIVLLGPVFAGLWTWLAKKGLEPSAPAKFGLGIIQLGAGFLVLVAGATVGGEGAKTAVLFIFLIYLLHTTGELCLSPVGLSAMNRLSPAQMASLIMGAWFFASAAGNFTSGLIAAATGSEKASSEGAAQQIVLDVYSQIGWIAVAAGVGVLLIAPLIKRLMHLDTLGDDKIAGDSEIGEAEAAGMHPEARSGV